MSELRIAWTLLRDGSDDEELLVVGPSAGTAVTTLWQPCVDRLESGRVYGWDLPGHGSSPAASGPFDVADLARAVVAGVAQLEPATYRAHVAGVGIGGGVALQVGREWPAVETLAVICSSSWFGGPEPWARRAALTQAEGTAAGVAEHREDWFDAQTWQRRPAAVQALFADLVAVDDASYAWLCAAIGAYDLREHLDEVMCPTAVLAGESDRVCPPGEAMALTQGLPEARLTVLEGVAHQGPAERPDLVAEAVASLLADDGR